MAEIVGLVLAAGAGRRMGQPKALVEDPATGLTWVEFTVAKLAEAGCTSIIVVIGAGADDVEMRLNPSSWAFRLNLKPPARITLVDAPDWEQGMGASLSAGLAAVEELHSDAPASVLITLVDLPDVGADVYRRILTTGSREGSAALVRAAYDGVPGHPVRIGRDHWAGVIETAHGDHGARDYFATHRHRLVECGDLATGRDVDTPADLAVAKPSAEPI